MIEFDDPNTKHTFSKDVIEIITDVVEKGDDPSMKNEFQQIYKILNENGHIKDEVCLILSVNK